MQDKGFPSTFMFPKPEFKNPNATRFRDNVVYHPLPFAALASQLAFPPTLANVTGAAANQYELMYLLDAQDRLKTGLPAFLAGYGWAGLPATISPPFPLTALAPAAVGVQAAFPASIYRQEIKEKDRKDTLKRLFQQDKNDFERKLAEFSRKITHRSHLHRPRTVRKSRRALKNSKPKPRSISTTLPRHEGFQVYRGKKLDDQFDVRDDPGMKPLIDVAAGMRNFTREHRADEFAARLRRIGKIVCALAVCEP